MMIVEQIDLSKVAARCNQVTNSPYLRRALPQELKNLRAVMDSVRSLATEDVPALIAEIKRLRSQNKRLEAENDTLRNGDGPGRSDSLHGDLTPAPSAQVDEAALEEKVLAE